MPSSDFAEKLEQMKELNARDGEILARKEKAWMNKKGGQQQGLKYMDGYYYGGAPNQQQQQPTPQSRNIGSVPDLGGTNSVFMGSNGGGLGFANGERRTQGLRYMDGYYYGGPQNQQQKGAPQSRNIGSVPDLGGTNSVFMGSNGGGLGFANGERRTQGLRYMDGYYYGGPQNQQQKGAPQSRNIGSVPDLGGTNSVFMGSNGGGLGFANGERRTQGLRYMDGYYYGGPQNQQQKGAPQSRNIGSVPDLGGTNSVFMGSNGGGLGFARQERTMQGLRTMQEKAREAKSTPKLDFLQDDFESVKKHRFNKLNAVKEHEPVATGYPGTYDGQWGEQYRRNAGGREEAMKKAGVNYDDYPVDVYKGVPWITFDPAATHQRQINQRVREPKTITSEPHIQTGGKNDGGEVWPVGWGTWKGGSAASDNLREGGIKVDHWPIDFYNGFPNPAWDKSEYDGQRQLSRPIAQNPEEVSHRNQESKQALDAAGVRVDGMPWEQKEHAYNNVDGALDKIVPYEETPEYREKGLAVQEQPLHFMLNDDLNGKTTTQKEAIENFWGSGKLDELPQTVEDSENGYEVEPEVAEEEEGPEEEGEPEEEME